MFVRKNIIALLMTCAIWSFGQAQIIVTFGTVANPPANCGDMWVENQVPMEVLTCSTFDYNGDGNVGLAPGSFTLKTTSMQIDSVCVTWTDYCGTGCTEAEFTNSGGSIGLLENILVGDEESQMFVNTNNEIIQNINLSSSEGFIHEVKIFGEFSVPSCPALLNVTNALIQTSMMSTFQASEKIESAATLDQFDAFTFRAMEVELFPDFNVPAMVSFEVQIGPCEN